VPELPEVEITARLIGAATAGADVESTLAPGINALKTFDPPLASSRADGSTGASRRGKLFLLDVEGELTLLIHLMSAGRLQLFDTAPRCATGPRGCCAPRRRPRAAPARVRHQAGAWVKLLRAADVERRRRWPSSAPRRGPTRRRLRAAARRPRPLHALLRDQHVIAGIGRSWVDEILHAAKLSPFKRGSDLDDEEAERCGRRSSGLLGGAIAHYEQTLGLPIPDKLPMPLTVHRQTASRARAAATLEAVFYEDYVMCYCPTCQTDGKLLKDRRLSAAAEVTATG
jgi:formamidopyrimidine-DNA glycosylase